MRNSTQNSLGPTACKIDLLPVQIESKGRLDSVCVDKRIKRKVKEKVSGICTGRFMEEQSIRNQTQVEQTGTTKKVKV